MSQLEQSFDRAQRQYDRQYEPEDFEREHRRAMMEQEKADNEEGIDDE